MGSDKGRSCCLSSCLQLGLHPNAPSQNVSKTFIKAGGKGSSWAVVERALKLRIRRPVMRSALVLTRQNLKYKRGNEAGK